MGAMAMAMDDRHHQEHSHGGHDHECCDGRTKWAASQSLDEMDFHKSLSAAAQRNDLLRMEELLRRGSPVDGDDDPSGYAPLHYASRSGHLDACILLLKV